MATARPAVEISEASTRTRLIMTAMRLFAADGVGKVSLRAISAKSGSRNTAAAHYHFENKLGLVEAVLGFIRREVWDPAQRRLEEAIERDADLRELLILGIWPSKMTVFDFPWGGDARDCLAYCHFNPDMQIRALAKRCTDELMDCFRAAVRTKVPGLPDRVFDQRWTFIMTEMVLGQWARTVQLGHEPGPREPAQWTEETERAYIEALLDYAVAGLKAPVTQWSHPNLSDPHTRPG
jgi:AcrR family transcriptional regulator